MTQFTIPTQMKAVVLDAYEGAKALRVDERPVPKPGPNEVLVKVAASPINPSDLAFLDGLYGFRKPLPTVPGFEGSGVVVAAGPGLMGRYLLGKRVACVSQNKGDGVWAEYAVTRVNYALPLGKGVSLEQGAMSVVNPLTAVALIDIAKKGGHKAIINTAAAGILGQMIMRLGQAEGLDVVNIVRREEQVTMLQERGAKHVLNSTSPDFDKSLKELCHQLNVRLAFDAVAGQMTFQLLEAMPSKSTVTIYGGLSFQPAQVSPGHVIFQRKQVNGFWLTQWLASKNILQSMAVWRRGQQLLGSALRSDVRARYGLEAVQTAVSDYQQQMTGGKVLIVPQSP